MGEREDAYGRWILAQRDAYENPGVYGIAKRAKEAREAKTKLRIKPDFD